MADAVPLAAAIPAEFLDEALALPYGSEPYTEADEDVELRIPRPLMLAPPLLLPLPLPNVRLLRRLEIPAPDEEEEVEDDDDDDEEEDEEDTDGLPVRSMLDRGGGATGGGE
jgi:hypothetical protein